MSKRRRSVMEQRFLLLLVVVSSWLVLPAILHGSGSRDGLGRCRLIEVWSACTLVLGMSVARRVAVPGTEVRLRLSERAASIGYWELDPATGQLLISSELKKQLGYRDEEVPDPATGWEPWVHPDDLERARAIGDAGRSTSPRWDLELRLRHRDGTYRWMRMLAERSHLSGADSERVLGCSLDVTERRQLEEADGRLREQLQQVERMSEMGALVAGVAHEVRNPLFGITATLDAMEARGLDPGLLRRQIGRLRAEVDRVIQLMNDLLDYGRPQGMTPRPEFAHPVITAAVESCRALAEQHQVEIEVRCEAEQSPILVDRERLCTALKNVIRNGIEHSTAGTKVAVAYLPRRDSGPAWSGFEVRDHGPGFVEDDLERVFDPFYSRRAGGVGLGLAIAQRIVLAHGGEIGVANHPEGGGRVTIRIPAPLTAASATPAPRGPGGVRVAS